MPGIEAQEPGEDSERRSKSNGDDVIRITFSSERKWDDLFHRMKRTAATEQLNNLRAALNHFDLSPDFGDAEAVDAIRRHLQVRIREAEGALRCPPWTQKSANAEAA